MCYPFVFIPGQRLCGALPVLRIWVLVSPLVVTNYFRALPSYLVACFFPNFPLVRCGLPRSKGKIFRGLAPHLWGLHHFVRPRLGIISPCSPNARLFRFCHFAPSVTLSVPKGDILKAWRDKIPENYLLWRDSPRLNPKESQKV